MLWLRLPLACIIIFLRANSALETKRQEWRGQEAALFVCTTFSERLGSAKMSL